MRHYRAGTRLRQAWAGDALVVVDARTGATHVLDLQGAELLARLEGWTSPAELAAGYLSDRHDAAEAERLADEVAVTLEAFTEMRLVDRR